MTLPVFWAQDCPDYQSRQPEPLGEVGTSHVLEGDSAHHAGTVIRLGQGERFQLADGEGHKWTCEVSAPAVKGPPAQLPFILLETSHEPAFAVQFHLVQALSKHDRDLQAVEAAIELGASRIYPWQADRSIVKWGNKTAKMQAKWENLALAANKQSRRSRWASVQALHTSKQLTQLIAQAANASDLVIVLDPDSSQPLTTVWENWAARALPDGGSDLPADGVGGAADGVSGSLADGKQSAHVYIIVGPEGGISPTETDAFVQAGAQTARLGNTILRASSAGPAALAALGMISGYWEGDITL